MIRKGMASVLGVGLVLFLVCGLYAQDVKYTAAPGVDWAKFKTYRWADVEGGQKPSAIVHDMIIQSFDAQLAAKGMKKVETDNPDVVVTYQVAVSEEKQWTSTNFGGYGGWHGGYAGWGGSSTTMGSTSTIKIGTLVFDVYDLAAKKHVWRGDATKTLNPSKNPEKNKKNLDKGIAKLLKNFPPPPPKK